MKQTLDDQWQEYRARIFKSDASSDLIKHTRAAFYCGASAALAITAAPTLEDHWHLTTAVAAELKDFIQELQVEISS